MPSLMRLYNRNQPTHSQTTICCTKLFFIFEHFIMQISEKCPAICICMNHGIFKTVQCRWNVSTKIRLVTNAYVLQRKTDGKIGPPA